jgi:hypothetical protein
MYRASETIKQSDMFKDSRLEMGRRTKEIFDAADGWHNRFREEVTNRVDEDIFQVLFSEGTGAPNAPIRILVAMMVLKEGLGISDEHLYEQCRFNVLIRSALGLFNSDEEVPTESTYYLFRQKIGEYVDFSGRNLLEEAFEIITKSQCREYNVSGKRVRMDSKLLGSNIGWYSRYGIVHETIRKYCGANDIKTLELIYKNALLSSVLKEKGSTVTYRSTKEEVERLFLELGILMYRLLKASGAEGNKEYSLLKRVFEEQYELVSGSGGGKKKKVKPRQKTEITAKSVQNPHDTDSEYRNKSGTKVKGYSINVTETCDKGRLNLIVDVQTEGSGVADVEYFKSGLEDAQKLVVDKIEEAYTDGAYHSPDNQEYCKEESIEWVLRGIQGKPSKYDLSFDCSGELVVVNTETGQLLKTRKAKTRDPQTPERWVIKDGDNKPIYFERKDVETCQLRKRLGKIPKKRLDIRNNVEATIFQLGYHCRGDKSQYRGLMKHSMWAISRCLWVNFRRIQLWVTRKAENGENDEPNIYKENFALIFILRFLRGYPSIFCYPVFNVNF